jgi:GT2 family glycosyltransferase
MAPFHLSKQSYRNFEVVLVDDGSTDGTLSQILDIYKTCFSKIKVIRNDSPVGLRKARNQGVKSAEGSIIVTLDLHTTFDEYFIERIVNAFSTDTQIAAVGALILSYGNRWFHGGFRVFNKALFLFRKRFSNYDYVFGTAAAYDAKVLEKIGFLSESDIVEDVDASWRIRKEGYKLLTVNDNVVFHKGPMKFSDFLKSFLRDGMRVAILLRRHKTKILYPQSLLRFLFLPLSVVVFFLFPIASLIAIFGVSLALLITGHMLAQNMKTALHFLLVTLLYVVLTSVSLYVAVPLIITGKTGAFKKAGLTW